RETLGMALREVGDLERLVSRAAQGHAGARDLVALGHTLEALPGVKEAASACEALVIRELTSDVTADPGLAAELSRALVDEPPSLMRDGGAIKAGYDELLDGIVEASRTAREWIAGLESDERSRTGIRSLKVGFNKVFGYYIEVSHSNAGAVPADYVRKQTLMGAE